MARVRTSGRTTTPAVSRSAWWSAGNYPAAIRTSARRAGTATAGASAGCPSRARYTACRTWLARRVYVCEGEKAADAARAIGLTGTTSAHGANSAGKTDWRPLAGKEIVILPDYDAAGRAYADAVAAILARLTLAPAVKIVELPDLPDHGDIVDWIALHGEPAQPANLRGRIEALADAVEPVRVEPIHDAPLADALRHEPYPVDALPEPLCGFVRAGAKAIGCDPSYVALPLLTVLAAAIGGTRRLLLKRGWSAPAILWARDRRRKRHGENAGVQIGDASDSQAPTKSRCNGMPTRCKSMRRSLHSGTRQWPNGSETRNPLSSRQ